MHTLALVRHAVAEDRRGWRGDDALRPLTHAGDRQAQRIAEALEEMLAGMTIIALRASPAKRCVQTLEPFALRAGMRLEVASDLFEGTRILPPSPRDDGAFVLCAHGDNIPWLLEELGVQWDNRCKKGSIWLVGRDGRGKVLHSEYRPIDRS